MFRHNIDRAPIIFGKLSIWQQIRMYYVHVSLLCADTNNVFGGSLCLKE